MKAPNKPQFYRKRHIIRTIHDDGTFSDETSPSINAAKRRSRVLQQSAGGLGLGSLRVVDRFPDVGVSNG